MENEYIGDLILVRGVSGSGKSTLAKLIVGDSSKVLSADDYFTNEIGEYNYDILKRNDAHEQCQWRCLSKMTDGESIIVVANTFTQEWEMSTYYKLAERFKYRVHSIIVENRHGGVNIHGVPDDVLISMRNRFQIKI